MVETVTLGCTEGSILNSSFVKESMAWNLVLGLVFVCFSSQIGALTKPSSIKLESNAYTGIVVAIHQDVSENQELIEKIKVSR